MVLVFSVLCRYRRMTVLLMFLMFSRFLPLGRGPCPLPLRTVGIQVRIMPLVFIRLATQAWTWNLVVLELAKRTRLPPPVRIPSSRRCPPLPQTLKLLASRTTVLARRERWVVLHPFLIISIWLARSSLCLSTACLLLVLDGRASSLVGLVYLWVGLLNPH